MKISEFMQQLYDFTDPDPSHYEKTCDVLKAGDPDRELTKIATTMFATPDVVRAASQWGANLLIVHEPMCYDHWDDPANREAATGFKREIIDRKMALIRESGLAIYRYHDHPHARNMDMICEGEMKYFGLPGTWSKGPYYAVNYFDLSRPMHVKDVAKTLETNLKIGHVRISGADDFLVKKIALCFGTPGHIDEMLGVCDIVLTGEICEWSQGEFARDCAGLGIKKAILVMGHTCSERDGMRLLVDVIREHWKMPDVKYFESGDCYSYAD